MGKKHCKNCMNYVTRNFQYYCKFNYFVFVKEPLPEELEKIGLQAVDCRYWDNADKDEEE